MHTHIQNRWNKKNDDSLRLDAIGNEYDKAWRAMILDGNEMIN